MSTYYDSVILADSPVSYWALADPSGTTAADSGDSNPGTYNGGFTLGGAAPYPGLAGSAAFNGSTGYVSVPVAGNIQFAGDCTLECWFKTSTGGVGTLVSRWLAISPFSGYGLTINDDSAHTGQFAAYFGGAWVRSGTNNADGRWHHGVATLDFAGSTVKLYVDGVLVTTATSYAKNLTSSNNLNFARSAQTGSQFFTGSLAGVALYPAVLTPAQIAAHVWASMGSLSLGTRAKPASPILQPAWTSGILAAYNLGEGSSTAADLSGNSHTGTLTGGCTWSSGTYGNQISLADNGTTGSYLALGSLAALGGVTEFTFSALCQLASYADSPRAGNLRALIGTSKASGSFPQASIYYNAAQHAIHFNARYNNFTDLIVIPPPLNQWVLITGRVTAAGEQSLWYDNVKVASQSIASFTYANDATPSGAIGDIPAQQTGNNWAGPIAMPLMATRGYADAEIITLAADPFAWDRPPSGGAALLPAM